MAEVAFTVDGRELTAPAGAMLLEVMLKNGIQVPYFCYHPALGMDGNCRMCMVEIEGQKRPQISCDTPVKEGMVVRTKGEMIGNVQKRILEFELINHPVDCPICDQAGECKLQEFYMTVGRYDSRLETKKVLKGKNIDLGSNVVLDQERCVLCARCVRFTDQVTGTHELGIVGRGDKSRIAVMPGKRLDNPYAMNVVDLCPVGALTSGDFRFQQRVWFLSSAPGVCRECARGCAVWVDHNREKYKDDLIYRFRPRNNDAVNGWFVCDRGRLSYKGENENRFRRPLVAGRETALEKALDAARAILEKHRGKLLFVLSPSLTLEEAFAAKLLAEAYGGSLVCRGEAYLEGEDDEMLIRRDKAANRAGMALLGIDDRETTYQNHLAVAGALVVVDHRMEDREVPDEMESIAFATHKCGCHDLYDVSLPIASWSEIEGSLVNFQHRLQISRKAVEKNAPSPELTALCAMLGGGPEALSDLRERLSALTPLLAGVAWENLPNEGITLGEAR